MQIAIPPSRHLTTGRTLINAADTGRIFARTETFKNSFYPHSIIEYNKLDITLRLCPSVKQFKQILVGNTSENRLYMVLCRQP